MNKAICIDLGSTLEDETFSNFKRAIEISNICKNDGIELTPENIIHYFELAANPNIEAFLSYAIKELDIPEQTKKQIKQEVRWDTSHLKLYDNAVDVLEYISGKHDIILIANQSKPVNERLKKYNISSYFKKIICSCEVGCKKPDIEIFKLAEQDYGDLPTEMWMIGDRIDNDIMPAKKLGWKTIRINQGFHKSYIPLSVFEEPDYTVNELKEIIGLF